MYLEVKSRSSRHFRQERERGQRGRSTALYTDPDHADAHALEPSLCLLGDVVHPLNIHIFTVYWEFKHCISSQSCISGGGGFYCVFNGEETGFLMGEVDYRSQRALRGEGGLPWRRRGLAL